MEHKPIVPARAARRGVRTISSSLLVRMLGSNRVVLGLALLFGVLLPEAFHWYYAGYGLARELVSLPGEPSFWATAAAIIAVHLFLNQLGSLPLVPTRVIIFPTVIITFGVVVMALQTNKLPFGRFHLWTGMAVTAFWYVAVSILRGRYFRPTIGPFGVPRSFAGSLPDSIDWIVIENTALVEPVDAVVVDPHAQLDVAHARFLTDLVLEGIPVYHRQHLQEGLTGKVEFHRHADNDFGALLPSLSYLRLKRAIDLAACVALALPFALAVGVAAVLIRFDSPGPVFYKAERTGYRGRRFICYKLRTMRTDIAGLSFTLESDPRITRLGAYLRKWRIDELPQIINVARGEMSWIGPRPEQCELAERYGANIPFYDYRHAVRPGLSGWAAVHQGNVGDVDAAREKLKYDFYYIKYFSFWLDALIVLKTVQTVLSGFGSR
jgi:lipopolysaccharide/colanic/teichoic acid biosynthesis glycosyltransferase